MTREEAIAIIRKKYLCVDRDCDIERSCGKCDLMMPSKEPILEAYKMAIEALEQEEEDPYQTDMDEAWNQVKHELESGFYHTEREEMTNEEAIAIISRPFDMSGVPSEILNAHKMAVEALEQEPCGDTISRQAVLDLAKFDGRLGTIIHAFDVEQLPAVTPAEKPCDDAISRQAILDLCHNHINGTVDANDIARLPAVTPAERATYRKKAKRWKNKYMKLKSEIAKTSPCDLCKYSPPSAGDNKPCTMCPAERSDKE